MDLDPQNLLLESVSSCQVSLFTLLPLRASLLVPILPSFSCFLCLYVGLAYVVNIWCACARPRAHVCVFVMTGWAFLECQHQTFTSPGGNQPHFLKQMHNYTIKGSHFHLFQHIKSRASMQLFTNLSAYAIHFFIHLGF